MAQFAHFSDIIRQHCQRRRRLPAREHHFQLLRLAPKEVRHQLLRHHPPIAGGHDLVQNQKVGVLRGIGDLTEQGGVVLTGLLTLLLALALLIRSVGVFLCMLGTPLSAKERLFCAISYLPKATVQAAIGSVPLALGLPCGQIVLSVAVLAIVITAPLGAIGIDRSCHVLLSQEA